MRIAMTAREVMCVTRSKVERVANVVRRIIGVPDYDRYVAHVRMHHPDASPLSRGEFERQRMNDRYSRPGSRCC
jgi:uncharacterized short protein YbdD (DUF466 family)